LPTPSHLTDPASASGRVARSFLRLRLRLRLNIPHPMSLKSCCPNTPFHRYYALLLIDTMHYLEHVSYATVTPEYFPSHRAWPSQRCCRFRGHEAARRAHLIRLVHPHSAGPFPVTPRKLLALSTYRHLCRAERTDRSAQMRVPHYTSFDTTHTCASLCPQTTMIWTGRLPKKFQADVTPLVANHKTVSKLKGMDVGNYDFMFDKRLVSGSIVLTLWS